MSLNLGVMSAAVTLDVSQYKRNLSTLENESGKTFSRVAKASAGFFTARALFGFVNSSMLEFSKFEEGNNKLKYTFTEVREEAERTAKQIAEIYNLAPQTATNAISDIGDMLTGFGFAQAQALDFAKQITERGIDIASFKGLDQTETIRRMTAALTGETDSLKMMGVVIRQDTSEFRDNIKTIQETTGATEAQAKAQAILSQIIEQTKNAEGDYLRPDAPRTYAQELTDLREAVKKFKLEIGTQLQPIAQDSVVKARELLNWYNELNPASKELLGTTTALAASLGVLSKSGILSSANKAFNVVSGGFSEIKKKKEADMIAATENLKRAEYAKTETFLEAHAAAQSLRVAKQNRESAESAIVRTKAELAVAKASGDQTKIIAAQDAVKTATNALTKAKLAEAKATSTLFEKRNASRMANMQYISSCKAAEVATKVFSSSCHLAGVSLFFTASGLKAAAASAKSFLVNIGPVGWAIIALSTSYEAFTYITNKYRDELDGAINLSTKAVEAANELAAANSKARIADNEAIKRLQELQKYESLNNAEKLEAEKIIKQLSDRYGELGIEIDKVTGKLVLSIDAFKKMDDKQAKEYGKDLLRKMKALTENIGDVQNGLNLELGDIFTNSWPYQLLVDTSLLKMFNPEQAEYSGFNSHQNALNAAMNLKTTQEKIFALEKLNGKLESENLIEKSKRVQELIDKLKEYQKYENLFSEYKNSHKVADKIDDNSSTVAQVNESKRAALDSYYEAKWKIKFDESDAFGKLSMLDEKLRQLNVEKNKTIVRDTTENNLTEVQLALLEKIQNVEAQRANIRKQSADAFSAEHESYAYYLENLEKQRREKAVDKEIEAARQAGDLISVDAIMQREFVKARDAANAMKREYERALHDAEADNIFTEEEKKRISELRRNLEEANATAEKYAIDKISSSEDQMQEARANSEAVGAFNSKILASIFGQTAPAEETAKNTRKTVEYLRELLISQENSTTMRYT